VTFLFTFPRNAAFLALIPKHLDMTTPSVEPLNVGVIREGHVPRANERLA